MVLHARRFWLFRQCIHPGMITGWWPEDVAKELQKFYFDLEKTACGRSSPSWRTRSRAVDCGYALHRLGRRAQPGSENHLRIVQRHARRAHLPRSATHSCARELHQDLPKSFGSTERKVVGGRSVLGFTSPARKPKSVIRSGRRTTTSPQHVNLLPDGCSTTLFGVEDLIHQPPLKWRDPDH